MRRRKDEAENICNRFVERADVPDDEKAVLKEQCTTNWRKISSTQHQALRDSCAQQTEDPESADTCVGFHLTHPEVKLKAYSEKIMRKVRFCLTEMEKAQQHGDGEAYGEYCLGGIPEVANPKDLINKLKLKKPSAGFQYRYDHYEDPSEITDTSPGDVPEEEGQPSIAPARTIILTRKFGLKPCDKTKIVVPRTFARFEKVTNRLIRAGAFLPDSLFEREGLAAAKRFYNKVRKTPSMEGLWQWRKGNRFQLKERMWRCAAQHAYFALRDYKTRVRLLRHLINMLQPALNIMQVFASTFPQQEVFDAVYQGLSEIDMELTEGQLSRVYLGNVLRWMRNLVKRGFRTKYKQVVASTFDSQPLPPHLAYELARWLARDMIKFLNAYLRTLSRRLTGVVKRALNSSRKTLPKTEIGALICRILKGHNMSVKTLDVKSWERVRKRWREETLERLEKKFREIDVTTLATHAVQEGRAGLTPERIMSLLFNFRPRRLQLGAGDLAGFKTYLVKRVITELEYRRVTLLKPYFIPIIQQILTALQTEPRGWLKRPHFQKQSIPFGGDDGQVYIDKDLKDLYILALHMQGVTIDEIVLKLLRKQKFKRGSDSYQKKVKETREYIEDLILFNEKTGWFEKVKKKKEPIRLQLRLETGNPVWFELKTPKRFLKLVQAGYSPQKATLLKKTGGGLILALPFEKEVPKSHCLKPSDLTQMQDTRITAGLDLGLKTLAVLSIGEGDQPVSGVWGKVGREIARYFLDQKQLCEKREDWFKPLKSKAAPPNLKTDQFPNFKRRLTNLQREARSRQAERDECRNVYRAKGINHRRKQEFFRLNRSVKRIWRNMNNLHEELARQVATRILAACEYHHVRILRMEDLRWAKHSKKYKVGYFLASWQIHWFFSQIQEHIADLAPRKGIFVEWVNARHTSTRCAHCGFLGKTREERKNARKGKIFKCPHCGFQLDSDLNAARNIRVAPLSNIPPSLYALVGGSPYLPLGDESFLA